MSEGTGDKPKTGKKKQKKQKKIQQQQPNLQAYDMAALQRVVGSVGKDTDKKHTFWDTQPMPHENDANKDRPMHCPIVPNKAKEELRQEPYNMPKGFSWCEVDILNEKERDEVYDLLTCNYVEDDDCLFRFDYSPAFLTWALTPPGFKKEFQLGVRSTKTGRLMAIITGVPATVRVYEKTVSMVEINFLCVHKKLRSKRLAPVLIKEITRRVNHCGVFQAVYTAGVVLPVPVASCRYYHRSLNPKKLVDIGFSHLGPRMTMARLQKLYRLPSTETSTPGLRPMTRSDIPSALKLLTKYLSDRCDLAIEFTEDELAHWILPREGVISSYVAVSEETGEVTDMCSFYFLPSTVLQNPRHNIMNVAYSFYNVATSVDIKVLMNDALILAKRQDQDVFNALSLMDNDDFLHELKFGIGDGNLQYYLYNWACPSMESNKVGIVLL